MTNEIYTLTNLKEYKENQYSIKLKDHLEKYIDFDELHFIENELYFFENCYHTANVTYWYYGTDIKFGVDELTIKGLRNEIIFKEIQDFRNEDYGFDLEKCERLTLTYSKILDFLNDKRTQLTTQPRQIENSETTTETATKTAPNNSLNWQGTPLQFTELTKALFETKLISPEITQKEFFNRMKLFFNIDDFIESDKIKEIVNRSNTPTPFINILEITLNNFRKNQLEKRKNN